MNQMHASVCVDLPADEFEEAAAKLKVKPMWEAFLKALMDAKVAHVAKLETVATRAKPATTGAKRGRKPRQPPEIPNGLTGTMLRGAPPAAGEAA